MPASRRRQGRAHARPWPGPEHTAHQLAASLQHAAGKSTGQRRARIEQLARANSVSRGHNIDLVDVRMPPGSTHRRASARAGRGACPVLARTGAHGAPAGGPACSCTWCAPGPVMRCADTLALRAILQHADGNRAGQRRARIEHLASINVAGHGRNTTDRRRYRFPRSTSPCRRRDGARTRRMHGPGQDRGARRTSWRSRLQLHLVRARSGNALRRYTRPAGHPAARRRQSRRPAPCAHRAPGQHQRRRPRPQHYRSTSVPLSKIHITMPAPRWRQDQAHARPWPASTSPATAATLPIDVGTAFQDPHHHAGAAMAPGPGACTALARTGAHGAPVGERHLQQRLVHARPGSTCPHRSASAARDS